ncbi:hypothetical protein C8R43DRAFT_377245 [Mycena crocata]|nr:hypothetical protein C8R43DRAFT_377245 [Mycena crocata]
MSILGGIVDGIFGPPDSGETTTTTSRGGILGLPTISLPSLPTLPGISIPGLPGTETTASLPSASASLPASDSASASLSALPSSSSETPSASAVSSPPISTSAATTPLPDVTTGADGAVHTVSHVVTVAAAETSASTPPAHKQSFLQNKALSGIVFALAGLLALVLIVTLATLVVRRRRRKQLMDDAVSFDPGLLAAATSADRYDGSEKGHSSNASLGTVVSGGRSVPGYGAYRSEPLQYPEYYGAPNTPQPEYYSTSQQSEYHGAVQQPYYSAYVPPMAEATPPPAVSASRAPSHSIPRVPVPQPLPAEFGSSDRDNRQSVEESEFWARTLKVANE